jgi:DNA-binding transcriptional regulator YhcF (GntR family)
MKIDELRITLLHEVAESYRTEPVNNSVIFDEDDARKYGVMLSTIDDVLHELKESGFIKITGNHHQGRFAYRATVQGISEDEATYSELAETSISNFGQQLLQKVEELEKRLQMVENKLADRS